MSFEKNSVLEIVINYVHRINGDSGASPTSNNTHLSQILDSLGFVNLIIEIESKFGVEISDEDFYEAELVTVSDLVEFVGKQQQEKEMSQ